MLNPGDATHMAGGMLKITCFSSTSIGDKERDRRATLKLPSDETWSLRNDRHQLEEDSILGAYCGSKKENRRRKEKEILYSGGPTRQVWSRDLEWGTLSESKKV